MKTIIVSNYDFNRLENGYHICVNGIKRFVKLKCINEETKEELIAKVQQIGGIWSYDASIIKF